MKNKTSLIVALSSLLACALFAAPAKINYQGLITNTAGEPIESSTNTVTVTLYQVETDGASVYTESFTDVASDADGIYSIQIGDTNLQAVLEANSELWLELIINGQTLSPRQEINSVPYALVADSANRLINASDSSISGDLSVSGNSNFGGDINVSGELNADRIDIEGPNGDTRFDGYTSRISGDYLDIFATSTNVFGDINVLGELDVDRIEIEGPNGDTRFDGYTSRISGEYLDIFATSTNVFGDINVLGELDFNGISADFENAQEVRVPTPDQPNEATNKAYVDAAVATNATAIAAEATTARAAEQANATAITAEATTARAAELVNADAITAEASTARAAEQANATAITAEATTARAAELVNADAITAEASTARAAEQANATAITALQSDVDQNESDADAAVAALQSDVDQNESDADTAIADIKTGDTVFSGSPSFTGVKPLPSGLTDYIGNYYELQPWYTSSSDVPNYATVNVDGLLNADVINAERMLRVGNLYITENEFRSDYGQVNISDLRTNSLRVDGDITFDGYRADFEYAGDVRVPTPDQDNEATNKAYVDGAVATNATAITAEATTARAAELVNATAITAEATTARAAEQANATAITAEATTARAAELVNATAITAEATTARAAEQANATAITAEATARASAITAAVSGDINASSLTTSGDLLVSGNSTFSGNSSFGNDIDVSGRVEAMDGRFHFLDVMGHMVASDIDASDIHAYDIDVHYRANFENAQEVRVPTPDQDNEATNKAYVDSLVVPSGGLVAWSSASTIPTGWSNAGLTSPMPNYIWIIKN